MLTKVKLRLINSKCKLQTIYYKIYFYYAFTLILNIFNM